LSTIQNTRRAEAYGSTVRTFSTSRPNGSTPDCGSQRSNSFARLTPPGRRVAERAMRRLALDPLPVARRRGQRLMLAGASLYRGLLVRRDHVLVGVQELALDATLVEVEHDTGLAAEVGVAPERPGTVVSGPDRILAEPALYRGAGDLLDDAPLDRRAGDRSARPPRELTVPPPPAARKPAPSPPRLAPGGNTADGPIAGASSPARLLKEALLPLRHRLARDVEAPRSRCSTGLRRRAGSPWRAPHHSAEPNRQPRAPLRHRRPRSPAVAPAPAPPAPRRAPRIPTASPR
jgi:hypothetical protein